MLHLRLFYVIDLDLLPNERVFQTPTHFRFGMIKSGLVCIKGSINSQEIIIEHFLQWSTTPYWVHSTTVSPKRNAHFFVSCTKGQQETPTYTAMLANWPCIGMQLVGFGSTTQPITWYHGVKRYNWARLEMTCKSVEVPVCELLEVFSAATRQSPCVM